MDLNTAKGQTPAKGVTDWTGATMVWFYVDAEDGAILDLELRAVKGEDTGFFTSKNADVKYYYQDEYGLVPVTLANDDNDWGHIALAEGYEGWVGVELANFACGSGHLADQNPVSYTHLDVYKRQVQDDIRQRRAGAGQLQCLRRERGGRDIGAVRVCHSSRGMMRGGPVSRDAKG